MGKRNSGTGFHTGKLAATSFVGRRAELSGAKTLLGRSRLVSFTGPGGMGKTRLAGEITRWAARSFPDGAWVVELASVPPGSSVAPAVARALDIPDQSQRAPDERLIDFLREKDALLILDNCEHLIDEASHLVDRVLAEAPKVRVLATSREPLGLTGEAIFSVPPLSVPAEVDDTHTAHLADFEAVALFVDRARDVVPGFELTADNAETVARLCSHLDGMPLAIELATARLRVLSVEQLMSRLGSRFHLLTGGDRASLPRQQTLRALIDWSFELCTDSERLLWRRLSVFPGSFDLEAVEAICAFGDLDLDRILNALDGLVAKSIVTTEQDAGAIRYHQLMTIREYGQHLLTDPTEQQTLSVRHLDHYVARSERMVRHWCGEDQSRYLREARVDWPNSRAALEWAICSVEHRRLAARLASLLRYQWVSGNFITEGRAILDRILESRPQEADPDHSSALWVAAWVSLIQGDHEVGFDYAMECLEAAQSLADEELIAHARHWLALHRMFTGDLEGAIDLYTQVAEAHRLRQDTAAELTALFQLGMARVLHDEADAALSTCQTAIDIATANGEMWNRAYAFWIRGLSHWRKGDFAAAEEATTTALRIQYETFQDGICTALSIEALCWITTSRGELPRAVKLEFAANSVWRELGTKVSSFGPHMARFSQENSAIIGGCSTGRKASENLQKRRRLSKAQAIESALGIEVSRANDPAGVESEAMQLTPKEREVAELVTQGMTNRAVAQRLTISPRTVDGHVERILTKLGFTTRTQIASWFTRTQA